MEQKSSVVLDVLGIGEDQSPRGLRRKTDSQVWIVRQHLTQCLLGLDAFRSDQNEAERTRNVPCPAANLDCEAQALQFRLSAQNRIGYGSRSRLGFHEVQQVVPAPGGDQGSRHVQRRVTVLIGMRKQPLRSAHSYGFKLTFAFGSHEVLEILVREADRTVLQPNARREVRAHVGELWLRAVHNRSQIRQGNRSRQGDQRGTKSCQLGRSSTLPDRVVELLPENISERLSSGSQAIERGGRMCSVHLECVVLHPRNAAREVVKVVNPGTRRRPDPSDVLSRFLPTEPLYLYGAVGTRQLQRLLSPGSGGDDETDVLGQPGQAYEIVHERRLDRIPFSRGANRVVRRVESDHEQGVGMLSSQRARGVLQAIRKQTRIVRSVVTAQQQRQSEPGRKLIRQLDEGVPRAMAQRAGVQVSTTTVAVVLQHDGPRGEGCPDFLQGGRLAHPSAPVQREVLDFRSEQFDRFPNRRTADRRLCRSDLRRAGKQRNLLGRAEVQ